MSGASKETPGMASARPTIPPFLPRTEGTMPLSLKLHWSSGGRVSMVVNPPEKLPRLESYGVLYTAKDSTASVGMGTPKLPVTGSVVRAELTSKRLWFSSAPLNVRSEEHTSELQ